MVTIWQFLEGLNAPTESLMRVLGGEMPRLINRPDGVSPVCCHSRFIEVEVMAGSKRYLLTLPTIKESLDAAYRVAAGLKRLARPISGSYRVLSHGLCVRDALGKGRFCDLIVEELPAGEVLSQHLLMGCCARPLIGRLTRLRNLMEQQGVAHNNLKPENLLVTESGDLLVIRPHRMTFAGSSEADRNGWERIISLVRDYDLGDEPEAVTNEDQPSAEGWIAVGPMCDERIRICVGDRYGFVDCAGELVIEPQFRWADDFREGRAEVEMDRGMGLIDKWGNFVVEACYDGLDYDDMEGTVRVRLGDSWALFDYAGRKLTDFEEPK